MNRMMLQCAAMLATVIAAGAKAQTDTSFVYQGVLQESGSPANGNFNIDVTLWDDPLGGSQQGPEIQFNGHPVADGRITLELDFGDRMMIPEDMWLQLSINGTELSPRQRLASAPVSIRTRGINVSPASDVGIGTAQPQAQLHIDGASSASTALRVDSPGTATGSIEFSSPSGHMGIAGTANGQRRDIWFMDEGLGLFTSPNDQSPTAGNGIFINNQGRVGVGTTAPIWDFNVVGNSRFDGAVDVWGSQLRLQDSSFAVYEGYLSVLTDELWASHSVSTGTGNNYWAIGFYGEARQTHGYSAGVYGQSASNEGSGVFGIATSSVGTTYGVQGKAYSPDGRGVFGFADSTSGVTYGVYGQSRSPNGAGVYGVNTATSGNAIALLSQTNSPSGYASYFIGPSGSRNYFQRNVGIGTTNPTFLLQLGSNSAAKPTSNVWTISSDRRLKKNIQPIEDALERLLALHGVTYQWRNPDAQGGMDGTYTGMIAQDVEAVFPEWIGQDADGYKTLTVIGFEGLVVEALRDLRQRNDAQVAELKAEHDAEIVELRERIARLESVIERTARPAIAAH